MILDEATANLDEESERLIQQSIDSLAENRTLLIIAHRLSTIEQADNILIIDQGKLVESGSHQTLLDKQGIYNSMIETLVKNEEILSNE